MDATEYMLNDLAQKRFSELDPQDYASTEAELEATIIGKQMGYLVITSYAVFMTIFAAFAAVNLDPIVFSLSYLALAIGAFLGLTKVGGTHYSKTLLNLIRSAKP